MKKTVFSIIFISLFGLCYSQSSFIDLCNLSLEQNHSLKVSAYEMEKARKNRKLLFTNYFPEFSFYSAIQYDEKDFQFDAPQSLQFYGEIKQYLPWGTSFYAQPVFGFQKNTLDMTYEPYAKLSIDIAKSMFPYFLDFKSKNPEKILLQNDLTQKQILKLSDEYELLDSLLQIIMNLKKIYRNISMEEMKLELYQKELGSIEELISKGNLSKVSFFSQQQQVLQVKSNLENYKNNKKNEVLKLKQILGFSISDDELEALLIEICNSDENFLHFRNEFSYWNLLYKIQLEESKLNLRMENLKSGYVYKRQSNAPSLNISLDCTYDSIEGHKIEASIGFDFSKLLQSEKLIQRKDFYEQEKLLKEEKAQNLEYTKELYLSYQRAYDKLFEENEIIKNELSFLEKIYLDYCELFSAKKCSELDFLQIRNTYYQMYYELENSIDRLNYYKLLLNMELSK